jgi:hypothetical protein
MHKMDYDKFYYMGAYIDLLVTLMYISLIFYSSLIHMLQSYFHVFSRQHVLGVVHICMTSTHVLDWQVTDC